MAQAARQAAPEFLLEKNVNKLEKIYEAVRR